MLTIFRKTFEGEMALRTQHTTPFQTFCEFILKAKIIFKSSTGADDLCGEERQTCCSRVSVIGAVS